MGMWAWFFGGLGQLGRLKMVRMVQIGWRVDVDWCHVCTFHPSLFARSRRSQGEDRGRETSWFWLDVTPCSANINLTSSYCTCLFFNSRWFSLLDALNKLNQSISSFGGGLVPQASFLCQRERHWRHFQPLPSSSWEKLVKLGLEFPTLKFQHHVFLKSVKRKMSDSLIAQGYFILLWPGQWNRAWSHRELLCLLRHSS